jgi:serine phosphatase RsbU (regulator of sigma subunit)
MEIKELRCTGLGIGLTDNQQKYEESLQVVTVDLDAADMLLFYTDGVIEAARPAAGQSVTGMEVFGERRLKDILNTLRGEKAQNVLLTLTKELKIFYRSSMG